MKGRRMGEMETRRTGEKGTEAREGDKTNEERREELTKETQNIIR